MITESATAKRVDEWHFRRHADLKWGWSRVSDSGTTTESRARFDTFADAMEDAVSHGLQRGVSRIVSVTPDRRFHPR